MPVVGDIILGQVTRVTTNLVVVDIVSAGGRTLSTTFRGQVRLSDILGPDHPPPDLLDCFRLGDVLRAQVVSLGDARSYFLSTAGPSLGVLSASSAAGSIMVPLDPSSMVCPLTQTVELRKVAILNEKPKI